MKALLDILLVGCGSFAGGAARFLVFDGKAQEAGPAFEGAGIPHVPMEKRP